MDHAAHSKIVSFIWGIADDVLRDLFVRGKYRDVILPMFVLRRLDAVLEPTQKLVLETKEMLDKAGITELRAALCGASGQAFYNTSKFTLRDLKARANQQQLRADFEDYLDGFSSNVQDILTNFEFRNIIPRLSKADALGTMIAKFLDPEINLSPNPVLNGDGTVKHPPMDNHSMGTVFEELVRKFNEENNEEAGEHWTPRDAVKLMANLLFLPIADSIESGSYLLYDGAAGTGGMLTVAESWKKDLEAMGGKDGMRDPRFKVTHQGEELNLVTRSSDGQLLFLANMVSKMNGKTKLGSRIAEVHNGSSLFTGDAGQGESNIRRWIIENDWLEAIIALPLNMFYNTGIATYIWVLSNKKTKPRRGKVQLIDATQWFKPLRKNLGKKNCELAPEDIQRICDTFMAFEETEQSKIFANEAFCYRKITVERPLRLHSQITTKTIESLRFASGDEDIRAELHDRFGEELFTGFAKIRDELEKVLNEWGESEEAEVEDEGDDAPAKKGLPEKKKKKLLDGKTWERDGRLVEAATALGKELGNGVFEDYNLFVDKVDDAIKKLNIKLTGPELKFLMRTVSYRVETAPPVIAKIHKAGKAKADPLHGLYANPVGDKKLVIEYEYDPELRDTEQVPLEEEVETFLAREVLPYTPDAWIDASATKIGYEVSFTRHFYQPPQLRTLAQISADILALEKETDGLLSEITKGVKV